MRIWSIHPQYLDSKGLVALWRETLLAKRVLEGQTRGYKNHPQLLRFKAAAAPLDCINHYLAVVYQEAFARGYTFDYSKVMWDFLAPTLPVTTGQVAYETRHLLEKLAIRDPNRYRRLLRLPFLQVHPLFTPIDGDVEPWEAQVPYGPPELL